MLTVGYEMFSVLALFELNLLPCSTLYYTVYCKNKADLDAIYSILTVYSALSHSQWLNQVG